MCQSNISLWRFKQDRNEEKFKGDVWMFNKTMFMQIEVWSASGQR